MKAMLRSPALFDLMLEASKENDVADPIGAISITGGRRKKTMNKRDKPNDTCPCAFTYNDNGKDRVLTPPVRCDWPCSQCGFNPDAMRRRFDQGNFCVTDHYISPVDGRRVMLPIPVAQLVFNRKEGGNDIGKEYIEEILGKE